MLSIGTKVIYLTENNKKAIAEVVGVYPNGFVRVFNGKYSECFFDGVGYYGVGAFEVLAPDDDREIGILLD